MMIATLISDWGIEDPYIGMFKGRLYSKINDIQIVDITHQIKAPAIEQQNNIIVGKIEQAAFLMKNAYLSFPEKTIHFLLIDTSLPINQDPILVVYHHHYFITDNNGILSLMFNEHQFTNEVYTLKHYESFYFTDKMIELATQVFQLSTHPELFHQINLVYKKEMSQLTYKYKENSNIIETIEMQVIYIDHFKNIVCNIKEDLFKQIVQDKSFSIKVKNVGSCSKIENYYQKNEFKLTALFNQEGWLEIGFGGSNLAELANIKIGMQIDIQIKN